MNVFSRPTPEARGLGMTSQRARDRLIDRLKAEGIADMRVLDVLRRLPRHLFIEEALASRAYEDTALPIGLGQTISQPWVVARMTEALIEHKLPAKVLEVGTGSGYQAAVLAALVENVYTVERIEELLRNARRRFRKLGIENIRSRHDDGKLGWPEHAPFDAIVLTAAGEAVDAALFGQLHFLASRHEGVLTRFASDNPPAISNATNRAWRNQSTEYCWRSSGVVRYCGK